MLAIARTAGHQDRNGGDNALSRAPGRTTRRCSRPGAGGVRRAGRRIHRADSNPAKAARPFFIDKLPNNFSHLGLIQLILPNAKIIDARRHPIAAAFRASNSTSRAARSTATAWRTWAATTTDYVDPHGPFRRGGCPGGCTGCIYEELVRGSGDSGPPAARLLRPAVRTGCLRFYENQRPVRTASSEQVRRPICPRRARPVAEFRALARGPEDRTGRRASPVLIRAAAFSSPQTTQTTFARAALQKF